LKEPRVSFTGDSPTQTLVYQQLCPTGIYCRVKTVRGKKTCMVVAGFTPDIIANYIP